MLKIIDKIIKELRPCFKNNAAYCWFSVISIGFIVRFDHYGVSSFIRCLFLDPRHYEPLIHFFRASSWRLERLLAGWIELAVRLFPVMTFNDRLLIIGDGIKVCKEAKKTPGVKRLHQDSDNSGKGEYIYGHHFGYGGLLVGNQEKSFCLPLHGQIHEGMNTIRPEEGIGGKPATLVTRMAWLVAKIALNTGHLCYAALDAYFSTGPAFQVFKSVVNDQGEQVVHLITRAKNNYVAYFDRICSNRRYHEDDKTKLMDWFDSPEFFETCEVTIYGKVKEVEYCCLDLLWKPIDDFLRFICVKDGDSCYVLMSSDLNLAPTEIITIYSYRSKIEVMFLFLKHALGGFCYRFWTKVLPKFNRKENVDFSKFSSDDMNKVRLSVEAIERFVNLAGMAMGMLQYIALTHTVTIWRNYQGWLRTYSSAVPSEEVVQKVVQTEFYSSVIWKVRLCLTLQIIRAKMRKSRVAQKLRF